MLRLGIFLSGGGTIMKEVTTMKTKKAIKTGESDGAGARDVIWRRLGNAKMFGFPFFVFGSNYDRLRVH